MPGARRRIWQTSLSAPKLDQSHWNEADGSVRIAYSVELVPVGD